MKCSKCHQPISEERAKKSELTKQKHKEAISKGLPWGRPRTVNYRSIVALRKQGFTYKQISEETGLSRGGVEHALKTHRRGKV